MLQTFGLEREGQQIGGCDDHAQGEMTRLIIIYWGKIVHFTIFDHIWSYFLISYHILIIFWLCIYALYHLNISGAFPWLLGYNDITKEIDNRPTIFTYIYIHIHIFYTHNDIINELPYIGVIIRIFSDKHMRVWNVSEVLDPKRWMFTTHDWICGASVLTHNIIDRNSQNDRTTSPACYTYNTNRYMYIYIYLYLYLCLYLYLYLHHLNFWVAMTKRPFWRSQTARLQCQRAGDTHMLEWKSTSTIFYRCAYIYIVYRT